ncbi:hypothetical protein [Abyssalbus ytuae]|uniref:Uncharacterized protein n=1 Tax=Abyssalbus ytuae TaxID=2926907 RepID=A0A9E6ZWS8_9FLAO|nr:hypothetical protein [Abyssalbus ytuae]UOB16627.1 hypothetical protein MQE35_12880 [Abyssalbus ytuae]
MFITVREYIVEERRFELKTGKCASGEVQLQLMRRDLRVAFFPFPKKVAQLICLDTGKKIKKSQWSPEIKAAALGMKSNHSVPMWGYYTFTVLALAVFIGVPVGFMNELKNTKQYRQSFVGQSIEQKKLLLQNLNTGDLVATTNNVYRIKNVNAKNVILQTSKNPAEEDIFKKLTNETYPETSFTGKELSIPVSKFVNGMISNTEMIINILNN